jgi:hypothetical protein
MAGALSGGLLGLGGGSQNILSSEANQLQLSIHVGHVNHSPFVDFD